MVVLLLGAGCEGIASYPGRGQDASLPDANVRVNLDAGTENPKQTYIGVFRDGLWILDTNDNHVLELGVDRSFTFGLPGDIPITGDWNGDGHASVGVFRATDAGGQWSLDVDNDGTWNHESDTFLHFCQSDDRPVVGDWDGVGVSRIGCDRYQDSCSICLI